MENMEIFIISVIIFCLNMILVLKIKDRLLPVFFMLFGTIIYSQLFSSEMILNNVALLFIGVSLFINVKGVEI